MRFTLVILMMLFVGFSSYGQNIIDEDFDSYTAGQQLVLQGAPNWDTWSSTPGSAEDPYVSDAQALSTPNSVVIEGTNDAVLLLGGNTDGRYMLALSIYVPSGFIGYYNILQSFAAASSEWGTQVYLDEGGWGHMDAGAADAGEFYYDYNEWFEMHCVIDLDEDYATWYYEDEFLVGWQWSTGTFGTGTLNELDAMNFYAWTGDNKGTPQCYFDDILIDQIPTPDSPFNLTATVNNYDVDLAWEVPVGCSAIGYYIFRDGDNVGYSTALSYTDPSVIPGDHTYLVRADYGNEISSPSNEVEVTVEGGTERDKVLLEIATGTWCQYCPGSSMGANQLVAEGKDVSVLEYHQGDDWEIPYSVNRIGYYGITSFPTAMFDGVEEVVGGSVTSSMYPTYLPVYEGRKAISAFYIMILTVDWADATNVVATVNIERVFDYPYDIYLRLALTESHIPVSWFGQTEIDYVVRDMYPDDIGTLVDPAAGPTWTFEIPISISDSWEWDDLELVAFLQDDATSEVMQSTLFPMTMTAMPEKVNVQTAIYPNPVDNMMRIRASANIKSISVYNSLGLKVKEVATDTRELNVNTSSWSTGMYIVEIHTTNGVTIEKVLKR